MIVSSKYRNGEQLQIRPQFEPLPGLTKYSKRLPEAQEKRAASDCSLTNRYGTDRFRNEYFNAHETLQSNNFHGPQDAGKPLRHRYLRNNRTEMMMMTSGDLQRKALW